MKTVLALLLLAALFAGCGPKRRVRAAPPPLPASRPLSIPQPVGHTETGIASWYGHPYHGRQAANGETYDMEQMTAAHRTLPFQTWVRVENLANRKTVEVRIIDRGPFVDGRIIDLSHAAAQAIDMIGPGTARVRLEVIRSPATTVSETVLYGVQVGAFRDRNNAERARSQMEARYGTARLAMREGDTVLWRVLVGSEPTEESAIGLADRIRQEIGERNAFVVRLDSEWLTASSAGRR
jgi:rare lipoprotein A